MNYIFCSDKQLLEINRKYLGKDYYTDIITFDLSDNKSYVRGESYISIERARDNAKALAIPFSAELHRVVFHGALHLCGYEDNTKKNILLMRKKEDYYLSLYKQGLFDLV